MRNNLLLLIRIFLYTLLASSISIFSKKYNFYEAIAIIFVFKWSFSGINWATEFFSYKLIGEHKAINYVLEILQKHEFPPRENYSDIFDDYLSGILYQPEKYSKNIVKHAGELEQELNRIYTSNYTHYLRLWKSMDEALNLYSPKYNTKGIFPPIAEKFDTAIKSNSMDSNIELLDAKNNAFKKILDNHIDGLLVNLYLATKYYPSWSKREDFHKFNFGVEKVESAKGEIAGNEVDFVVFWFKKTKFKIGSSPLYGIDTKSPDYECVEAIKLYFDEDEKPLMEFVYKKKLDDNITSDFIIIDVIEYHENHKCIELLKDANDLIEKQHKKILSDIK